MSKYIIKQIIKKNHNLYIDYTKYKEWWKIWFLSDIFIAEKTLRQNSDVNR